MTVPGKRQRKPQAPFFSDPDAERRRVEDCRARGLNPYPKFKHVPCEAERALREQIIPGVPFKLVLSLNDCDQDGRPVCRPMAERQREEARAARLRAAHNGGQMRERKNFAASTLRAEAGFIKQKLSEGRSKSWIINAISVRLKARGQKCPGRSEMYENFSKSLY